MNSDEVAGECAYPREAALQMVCPYAYFTKEKAPDY